jgi:glycosyltransferase involved in cell wall biosynthesis
MAAIDVLLPVKNGMPFLNEAIESIRRQTFSDWRLLVMDHGSSDGSRELALRHAETDKRIAVFSHPEAEAVTVLRNIGLGKCDCRYLLLQDADDVSFPNRMEVVARRFEATPGLLLAGSEAIMIDPAGNRLGHLRVPAEPKAVAAAAFFYNPVPHPTVAADFRALQRLGVAYGRDFLNDVPATEPTTITNLAEDYVLFGQLAVLAPCANIQAPLIKYRRHPKAVGIANPKAQIEVALTVSRFLARSFCRRHGLESFDPGPFCNHADYVFDFGRQDYEPQFAQMADILRRGLGSSAELERELAFRRVLATRRPAVMAARYLRFAMTNATLPSEGRTVRNWLLKDVRRGRYVYRPAETARAAA